MIVIVIAFATAPLYVPMLFLWGLDRVCERWER
jgi:hypothetical protein